MYKTVTQKLPETCSIIYSYFDNEIARSTVSSNPRALARSLLDAVSGGFPFLELSTVPLSLVVGVSSSNKR